MWTCPNCGERGEDNFAACWKCGAEKDDSSPLSERASGATKRAAKDFGTKREILRRNRTNRAQPASVVREGQPPKRLGVKLPSAERIQAADFPVTWDDDAAVCPQCGMNFTSQFMREACFAPRVECLSCGTALRAVRKTSKPKSNLPALLGAGIGILVVVLLASLSKEVVCFVGFAIPFLLILIVVPIVISASKSYRPRVTGFRVIETQSVSDNSH
ncbi:MAG: hypothetical protein QOH49_155 [Acidobacteriota bacterium]|jgi:Zn ribbon nucleic-acid-binding protein|nr:hypothetical protein [Acidobacteriota bacterium]